MSAALEDDGSGSDGETLQQRTAKLMALGDAKFSLHDAARLLTLITEKTDVRTVDDGEGTLIDLLKAAERMDAAAQALIDAKFFGTQEPQVSEGPSRARAMPPHSGGYDQEAVPQPDGPKCSSEFNHPKEITVTEQQLRHAALESALRTEGLEGHEAVVKAAEAYLAFLKSEDKSD